MGVPRLCGQCHREGTPVSQTHNIPQTNILGNYVDSIHGEGLFKRGLVVTAVCTSCHTSHFVLPHTDSALLDRQSEYRQDLHQVPRPDRETCTRR